MVNIQEILLYINSILTITKLNIIDFAKSLKKFYNIKNLTIQVFLIIFQRGPLPYRPCVHQSLKSTSFSFNHFHGTVRFQVLKSFKNQID